MWDGLSGSPSHAFEGSPMTVDGEGVSLIYLEVIAPIPAGMQPCAPCERVMRDRLGDLVEKEMVEGYPPEFLAEFDRLVSWLDGLPARFDRLRIRVIDPQSPEGLWKCLRHNVHPYPAFILQGKRKVVGWDPAAVEQALEEAEVG